MIDVNHRFCTAGLTSLTRLTFLTLLVTLCLASFIKPSVARQTDNVSCPTKLNNCTQMVKPYLRDVRYMFPTNIHDVDEMCRLWGSFVDCVRRYITSCFSDDRRSKFNAAVEHSVDTVHAICSSEAVQREYLNNAECFKKVSVENCGNYYAQLIDHVANSKSHDDHICCSYGQFKRCVHDPLLRECGHRARNLMDHSMGFLVNRCVDKEHLADGQRCPSPPPTVEFETEMPYNEINGRARADRSHETTITSMMPESDSITSTARTVAGQSSRLNALLVVGGLFALVYFR